MSKKELDRLPPIDLVISRSPGSSLGRIRLQELDIPATVDEPARYLEKERLSSDLDDVLFKLRMWGSLVPTTRGEQTMPNADETFEPIPGSAAAKHAIDMREKLTFSADVPPISGPEGMAWTPFTARVTSSGHLAISLGSNSFLSHLNLFVPATWSVRLARWILEVFENPPKATRKR